METNMGSLQNLKINGKVIRILESKLSVKFLQKIYKIKSILFDIITQSDII